MTVPDAHNYHKTPADQDACEVCNPKGVNRPVLISCPVKVEGETCGGQIQMTRRTYWSLDKEDGYLYQEQEDQPDMWQIYCEHDHQLYGDNMDGVEFATTDFPEKLLELMRDHPPLGA